MSKPVQTVLMSKPLAKEAASSMSIKAVKKTAPKTQPKTGVRTATRTNDPARTMAGILDVATAEFAAKGLAGARIDEIAATTQTSKRMIYYYFESKVGLYIAVLEEAYRRIRQIEQQLHLEDLEPEEALRKLVGFTVDYQWGNPDFVRLVMNENIHRGEFLAQSKAIQGLNVPVVHAVQQVYERGVEQGVFRPNLDPLDLHMSISALSFFNVANHHTFSLIFKHTLENTRNFQARRNNIIETMVRYVKA
ncbi:MAG TPA: TetR/AcrR family transcriptional regulator [Burkholderiaceae bacterium]|nr:TetR/AcrR family transcriptional regulator [Burkholderiaceae bacterium]